VIIIVKVYFVIDSIRKLLDTPSYTIVSEVHAAFTSPWRRRQRGPLKR